MAGMTLSFKRYALVLAGIVAAIYVILGIAGYAQYQSAKQNIEQVERLTAGKEFQRAFARVVDDIHKGADALAEWDELYQQLSESTYFAYWYSHRILNRSGLDSRFVDLMVYGPDGRVLSVVSDSTLPRQLEAGKLRDRFVPAGKDVLINLFRPLKRAGDDQVLGYLAVQARVMPNIVRLQAFNRIELNSLQFKLQRDTQDPEQVVRAISYRLLPTPSLATMDQLVLNLVLLLGAAVLLPTMVSIFFFARHIGRAVEEVPVVVEALRQHGVEGAHEIIGRNDFFRVQELEIAERSLVDYHRELMSANASLDEKNQELWDLAHRDGLTGAQNRRAFDTFWNTLQAVNERSARSLRLMLCDVNRFKAINDTYGHEVGDAVLQAIVQCLHRVIRRDEQLFRLGGDEFACVLVDCDDQQAMMVASRCEHEVASYPFAEKLGIREPVRLSIGISPVAEGSDTPVKILLRQADVAMYQSKRPASGSICIYREDLESRSGTVFSSTINEAVYRAIEHGEGLVMHYQLIHNLGTHGTGYYEALLRIKNADELIYPGEIMPIVESRHLERELDQAVIDHLLQEFQKGVIPPESGVSINLSAASVSDERIVARLEPFRDFLSDFKLVLEVTETALITQMEVANKHLTELRKLGFLVALDDFGSGYSSLSYLTSMPVDIVKFDISLIKALHDETHRRLVEHLLEFISSAGQATVAEGVEDEVTLQQVREIGFDYVQGYLLGRPQALSPLRLVSESTA